MRKVKNKKLSYARYGYYFSIPFAVAFLLFTLYPIVYTVIIGFTDLKGLGMTNFHFLTDDPFRNFKTVLTNPSFKQALSNTVVMWLLNFIPQILLALLLTAWFTDKRSKIVGQGFFKVIFYMPNIITAATIAVLFYSLFDVHGSLTEILRHLGLAGDEGILTKGWWSLFIIAFIQFWMWYGNTMIVLIAGILGINPSLYEAAMVDGASGKQQFFYITLPLLKPIIQFSLVTSCIGGLQMYDIPSLFNVDASFNGMPNFASETITMWIKFLGFTSKDYGKAAAASMVLFVVTMIISLLFFALTKEREPKQRHAVVR